MIGRERVQRANFSTKIYEKAKDCSINLCFQIRKGVSTQESELTAEESRDNAQLK